MKHVSVLHIALFNRILYLEYDMGLLYLIYIGRNLGNKKKLMSCTNN